MPPLMASSVPPLVKLVAGLTVRVRPLTCEEISPLLVRAMAAVKLKPAPTVASLARPATVLITPLAPTVRLPGVLMPT